MSRLTDLLAQTRELDPKLAIELEKAIRGATNQRKFGLVFERHLPDNVELPSRPVRKGDTVRILPPRGSSETGDPRLWSVSRMTKDQDGNRVATLVQDPTDPGAEPEVVESVKADDLVVVARLDDTIYPGLVQTGEIIRSDDPETPFHTVINAENQHALKLLTYTHRHKIDCIYIDPPYNTGAKDWKYNNDYVDGEDQYRHSKWLSFMESRLLVAKQLLNPDNSVLIVTIDEKEYLRLGILLEQTFPEARIQMVSSVISQKGSARTTGFSRCDEYVYFVALGKAMPVPHATDMLHQRSTTAGDKVEWGRLTRNGRNGRRGDFSNLYYPIYFNRSGDFLRTGAPVPSGRTKNDIMVGNDEIMVLPTATDGSEMTWGLSRDKFEHYLTKGYLKFGKLRPNAPQPVRIYYLTSGYVSMAEEGRIHYDKETGNWIHRADKGMRPMTIWNMDSHNAAEGGTNLVKKFIGKGKFDFPKSMYAVEDTLSFFVKDKPYATVLDFFSGSGTTAHAVMRLNKQDGGKRRSISVTNNEVSFEEAKTLTKKGYRPGDPEWEKLGICDYVTKPRIEAAITGKTPEGNPIKGDYKFTDEFPMADGFEANARFFTLTYEPPTRVRHGRAFDRIAPLLWLRAGQFGRVIEKIPERGWDVAESHGVIQRLSDVEAFAQAVREMGTVNTVYIVANDDLAFQSAVASLEDFDVDFVQLYSSYLTNFSFTNSSEGI